MCHSFNDDTSRDSLIERAYRIITLASEDRPSFEDRIAAAYFTFESQPHGFTGADATEIVRRIAGPAFSFVWPLRDGPVTLQVFHRAVRTALSARRAYELAAFVYEETKNAGGMISALSDVIQRHLACATAVGPGFAPAPAYALEEELQEVTDSRFESPDASAGFNDVSFDDFMAQVMAACTGRRLDGASESP